MASKMIQEMLTNLSSTFGRNTGVIQGGEPWFTKEPEGLSDVIGEVPNLLGGGDKALTLAGYTFLPLEGDSAVSCVEGTDEQALKSCEIINIFLDNMRQFQSDKYDRNNFIKNLLSDNILPNEVLMRSQELQFDMECSSVVMIIRTTDSHNSFSPIEVLHTLFPNREEDHIIQMDEQKIALVKTVTEDYSQKEGQSIAEKIMAAITEDALSSVTIGIGSRVDNIRSLAKSYKDATVALEVGKVFDSDKAIIHYESLGIGRLIYQLPTTLCELFLSEIFKKGSLDSLDRETLHTIQKFFENNLNISEASRQLYVHRNTLVYRLDKVQKLTGLDLRIFDHAIVFKVALMVKKYLDSNPMKL